RTYRGLVRVWTKCLSQQGLEKIDVQHDFNGRIVESAARKTDNGYVPPIARIEDGIDLNKATVITRYEETANIAPIQPRASIFYELNCARRMLRERIVTIFVHEVKRGSAKTPSSWRPRACRSRSISSTSFITYLIRITSLSSGCKSASIFSRSVAISNLSLAPAPAQEDDIACASEFALS